MFVGVRVSVAVALFVAVLVAVIVAVAVGVVVTKQLVYSRYRLLDKRFNHVPRTCEESTLESELISNRESP